MRWIPTNKKLKHFDKLWRIMTDENFDECTYIELAFKFSFRSLKSPLSATIKRRRLTLAGHVSRHKEPAGSLIFWAPEEPRRRGRPNTTLIDVLKSDTGLNNDEMRAAMTDRSIWKTNFIMSPD